MKDIEKMSRMEIEEAIEALKAKKLWQRSDEENARLTKLAHRLEDLDGNIEYGDTDEEDFDESAAKSQDERDGPLEE